MGKSYAVTGSARGLGLAWVLKLSSDPSNVVFALARNTNKAEKLIAIAKERQNVVVVQADTSVREEIERAVEEVKGKFGEKGLDVLVNNAGIAQTAGLKGHPAQFRVNTVGPILTTELFLPLLREGTDKKIVVISSDLGLQNTINPDDKFDVGNIGSWGAYAVSKNALNMAVKKLALELRKEGFVFGLFNPGWVRTDMGGSQAHLSAEESVDKMQQKMELLKQEDSAVFWDVAGRVDGLC
ncbi:NAD(P)-binding protein [Atractiella rhizophila]|nr:NAD(P)-binding protein [Atractiella rhizophila]